MPKPKIYYIKGKKYKGIELTLEEQQALCRKNLRLIAEQNRVLLERSLPKVSK